MSFERKSGEYVGVLHTAYCFMPIHIYGEAIDFPSPHLEADLAIAQAAAQAFAQTNQMDYSSDLIEPSRPIMTIIKSKGQWFPAKLYPERIVLSEKGESQQEATGIAFDLALTNGFDCFPSIGISLEQ